MRTDVVIVGGGITGLAAAYRLHAANPEFDIILIEASHYLGGKIYTERVGGFILEGGPDCFLARKPRGVGLCAELGVTERLQGRKPAEHKAYVLRHGRLHPLPEGLSGMIPTNLDALRNHSLLSKAGAERVAREPDLPPKPAGGDESVGAFVSRRLGREAFENLVEPLMGGIYAGQADQLSLAATFPQLRWLELKYGSLIGGLASVQAPAESAYPPFVSFEQGMGALVDIIVEKLKGVEIRLNSQVRSVKGTARGAWRVEIESHDEERAMLHAPVVILTTPAYVTADLLAAVSPALADTHAAIPYASTALVSLAFDKGDLPALPAGYGYVIPQIEGRKALACTWTSQKWAGRAPEDKVLLRVYVGRYGEEDVTAYSEDQLLAIARSEIRETLGITADLL